MCNSMHTVKQLTSHVGSVCLVGSDDRPAGREVVRSLCMDKALHVHGMGFDACGIVTFQRLEGCSNQSIRQNI